MHAYAVIGRPGADRTDFVMYVAMVASREAAIEAVRTTYNPKGELEISGFVTEATIRALDLKDGEVRRL